MNTYLQNQYRETKSKFDKFSSRLQKSQDRGEFYSYSERKKNFLLSRIRKLWEKLRVLEVRLKITTAGAALALLFMVPGLAAQDQFVPSPDKNPMPIPSIFGFDPTLVDVDNDGDLDLLCDFYYSVQFYENTGTTTSPLFNLVPENVSPFRETELLSIRAEDVTFATDFDGDGDHDLFTDEGVFFRNTGDNDNIVYEQETIPGNFNYYAHYYGDIDNDGDLDALTMSTYSEEVVVYRNTGGPGTLVFDLDNPVQYVVTNWDEYIDYSQEMHVLDIDDDGDLDILFAAGLYSYLNGDYDYWREAKLIVNTGTATIPVFAMQDDANNPYKELEGDHLGPGDLDGDGDYDILQYYYYESIGIDFYELNAGSLHTNKDLVPEFNDGVVLPFGYYFTPQLVDYDGDGDLDVFVWNGYGAQGGSHYIENKSIGSEIAFEIIKEPSLPFVSPDIYIQVPRFIDLDMDGDLDVVRISYDYNSGEVIYEYLENTGSDASPVYTDQLMSSLAGLDGFHNPNFVDIDNDGDFDVFMTSYGSSYYSNSYSGVPVIYYESTGSNILEFTQQPDENNPLLIIADSDLVGLNELHFSDIDEDGDYDVMYASYYDLHFLENTGNSSTALFESDVTGGPFANVELNYYAPRACFVDYDKDGDNDLFVFEYYAMFPTYYENTGPKTAVPELEKAGELRVYPNPAAGYLQVEMPEQGGGTRYCEIDAMDGKQVWSQVLDQTGATTLEIDVGDLDPGTYILRIRSDEGVRVSKFVKQ